MLDENTLVNRTLEDRLYGKVFKNYLVKIMQRGVPDVALWSSRSTSEALNFVGQPTSVPVHVMLK